MKYEVNGVDWVQISRAGKNVTAFLDEQDDGAVGHMDVRVLDSVEKPSLSQFTDAKRVYKPIGNRDTLILSPSSEYASFWAMCNGENDTAIVNVFESGYGETFTKDVYQQDQHSPDVETFFTRELGSTTLASDADAGVYSLTVGAGHGFTAAAGEVFVVEGYFISRVLSVAGNAINLAMPTNIALTAGITIKRGSTNLLVDGSSTPVTFVVTAGNRRFDMTGMRIVMQSANAMDYTKLGGATAPTLPMVFREKLASNRYNNLFAIRNNLELEEVCDLTITGRAPSGQYGLRVDFPVERTRRVVHRIDGELGQQYELIVRGNQLVTQGNSIMEAVAYGHVVMD